MELPKGLYARLYDRSSTPKKFKVSLGHSVGIIDNSYNSDKDIWKYSAVTLKTGHGSYSTIKAGDRICQFEICLSQRATVWQKLKWLFTSGYKFKYVDHLDNEERGGFGSTNN
jgi:dUTPase